MLMMPSQLVTVTKTVTSLETSSRESLKSMDFMLLTVRLLGYLIDMIRTTMEESLTPSLLMKFCLNPPQKDEICF